MNFGDPIWPEPQLIQIPRVLNLGQPPLTVLGYPLTMVLAEKIVTAVERGEANTRWRDFADIYTLTRLHRVDAEEFGVSLETVAAHRQIGLLPLLPALSSMAQRAQPKWRAWRARTRRESDVPLEFADMLETVATFAEPALMRTAPGVWNPQLGEWEE